MFELENGVYTLEQRKEFLIAAMKDVKVVQNEYHDYGYLDVAAAFDIETTSFIDNGEKAAVMYIWQLGINGRCIYGRTWQEFVDLIEYISRALHLSSKKRLPIYVHNLQYEFQFMRKHFKWLKMFARENRTPMYALTTSGIEFRCSLILSGVKLAKMGKDLVRYKVEKLVGDLDYGKIRHSKTPLTDRELGYCLNDIRVVMSYIQELLDNYGSILEIPYTRTGFVRRAVKKFCRHSREYRNIISKLQLTSADEYRQLKRAFAGGFTHASAEYVGMKLQDVTSYDFTSSYPAVMVSERYPMSTATLVEINSKEEFESYVGNPKYCCLFDVSFVNLIPRIGYENYISFSRCTRISKNHLTNNGRVVFADYLETTMTEQDYAIVKEFYTWDEMSVNNFRVYKAERLPMRFIQAILKIYADKTELKGVEGREIDYAMAKAQLNSLFGMCVTDIAGSMYDYDSANDDWVKENTTVEKAVEEYNKSKSRFLSYAWGIWITAYARRNLFSAIREYGLDYVYSDTDSVKVLNAEKHENYIATFNKLVELKMKRVCKERPAITVDSIAPKTIKGETKWLGFWEKEHTYQIFKTLGAKRYMVKYVDEKSKKTIVTFTVAGCNKKNAIPYMIEKYGGKCMTDYDAVFDAFDDNLEIPCEYTGKLTHTYIDDIKEGVLIDYMGNPCEYKELSAIHLEKAPFSMSIDKRYVDYIRGYREKTFTY